MTAIITGDIINSTSDNQSTWLHCLREVLKQYGSEPKKWEIFRGDSFQIEVEPKIALHCAIHIKAAIKQQSEIDVRMAIGIGDKNYSSKKITESNGEAFIFSGKSFDALDKNRLIVKTARQSFDEEINLYLDLASLTMDQWLPATAHMVKIALEHPDFNQSQISTLIKKSQSHVSQTLKRAGYETILKMINAFQHKVISL